MGGRLQWQWKMLKTVHFQDVGITPFEKERRKFVYDFFFRSVWVLGNILKFALWVFGTLL